MSTRLGPGIRSGSNGALAGLAQQLRTGGCIENAAMLQTRPRPTHPFQGPGALSTIVRALAQRRSCEVHLTGALC